MSDPRPIIIHSRKRSDVYGTLSQAVAYSGISRSKILRALGSDDSYIRGMMPETWAEDAVLTPEDEKAIVKDALAKFEK